MTVESQVEPTLDDAERDALALLDMIGMVRARVDDERHRLQGEVGTLRAECAALRTERDALRAELESGRITPVVPSGMEAADLDGDAPRLQDELARTREELRALRERVHSTRFWTEAFARPFAVGVHEMNAVHSELAVDDLREVADVFRAWGEELTQGVAQFAEGGHDEAHAERLRRLLLAQWVYLQWSSVTAMVEDGKG